MNRHYCLAAFLTLAVCGCSQQSTPVNTAPPSNVSSAVPSAAAELNQVSFHIPGMS